MPLKKLLWLTAYAYMALFTLAISLVALVGIVGGVVTLTLWPSLAGLALIPVAVLAGWLTGATLDAGGRA